MFIPHKIYGRFNITEPVLIELIKSPALQRLKGINQHGAQYFHKSYFGKFTRYQHSIGVMLLLRKFDAGLNEQIAGLLHDISHTAFSHVIDRVFGRELKQDYQDSKLTQAFELQGVNKILKKHGIKPKTILNFSAFTLLENELPDLCADRIDYTLQDQFGQKYFKYSPKRILDKLIVYRGKFVFSEKKAAAQFARLLLKLNDKMWCNPWQSALFVSLADIIRLGLAKKIINKKDLFTTNREVVKKLKSSNDVEIIKKFRLLKNLKVKIVPRKSSDLCLKSKFRAVDPEILINGQLVRLSKIDHKYKSDMAKSKKLAKKGYYIKF